MRSTTLGILAGIIGIIATAPGCNRAQGQPAAPPPPSVTVAQPVIQEVVEFDEYSGRLEASDTVEVRPKVSGYIQSVLFQDGALVNKGDPLFVIDPRPFQAELDRAVADEKRAEVQLALAKSEFERAEKVLPTKGISQEQYDQRKFAVQQAEATLASAKAAVEAADLNVKYCHINAETAGRISRRYVDVGNLVSGGSGTQATLLTTIVQPDPIYCYVDADERSVLKYQRLSREKKRMSARETKIPAFLALPDETSFTREGFIDFVDNRIDPSTGTLRARAIFANPTLTLTPGLSARLQIPGSGRYEALLVNDAAIASDQASRYLLVVNAQNKVERRTVKIGALFGDLRAILSGVGPEDWIVINGQVKARPGAEVAAIKAPMPGNTGAMTGAGSPSTQALPRTRSFEEPTTGPGSAPATR